MSQDINVTSDERCHKTSMLRVIKDERQLINFGRTVPGIAGESVFLSSCIKKVKINIHIIISSFLDIILLIVLLA